LCEFIIVHIFTVCRLFFIFAFWEKFFPLVKYMLDKCKIFNDKNPMGRKFFVIH